MTTEHPSFCYNLFAKQGATANRVLFRLCYLSHTKKGNWSGVHLFGLTTSVFETVSHPLSILWILSTHRTQEEARQTARNIAINQQSEVVIHRPNGQIRDKDSYGNDPFPPRG
jgi:hypothetical protein